MGSFQFGGREGSFFGDSHAQGEDAVNFYTEKTIEIERDFNCCRASPAFNLRS